jgi:hypothetical protein
MLKVYCLEKKRKSNVIHFSDWEEGTRFGCWLFGISILLLLVIIPIVYRPSLLRLNLTDQLDMSVLANDFKQMVAQCKRYPISQGIIIVSGVSIFFIVCLSLLINQRRKSDDFCNVLTGMNLFHLYFYFEFLFF